MDVSVNKLAKDYLKKQFDEWYSKMVMEQLDAKDMEDLEGAEIQPINLGMLIMKEVGEKWPVEMAEYISDNPHIIVKWFVRSGIISALDGLVDMGPEEGDDNHSGSEDLDSTNYEDYDSVFMMMCKFTCRILF